ncbi:MAG: glycerophosphoryl diester phosphodiesterase [Prevotella sp.]|nr:glycerophosphoryl diester phosphodiesterase [Prevotella sp.]
MLGRLRYIVIVAMLLMPLAGHSRQSITWGHHGIQLAWEKTPQGYRLKDISVNGTPCQVPLHQHSVLYAKEKPSTETVDRQLDQFPEPQYRYLINRWKESITPVSLNLAGEVYPFLPQQIKQLSATTLQMTYENDKFRMTEEWAFDTCHVADILIKLSLEAKQSGYFSLSSPSLVKTLKEELDYAMIPGVLHGHAVNPDFIRAYAYAFGIPDRPVVVRERSVSTLASLITDKHGITTAVIAEPGTGRDPWEFDKRTHQKWLLGLSLMNRQAELTPTLYHPVLGEEGSYLAKGQQLTFRCRYSLATDNWYERFTHIVNDVYRFSETLSLRQNKASLTSRLYRIYDYLLNDSTSMWRNADYQGLTIGAQDYLGGVYQSEKDAMKNADYGAMWMLARETGDQRLLDNRLPYALQFKLQQQNRTDSFFLGAPLGQYYLYKSHRFTEEWGAYTEPIGTTYYMLMDLGNIFLFEPQRSDLKEAIRLAADRLLKWMSQEGEWSVAYDNATHDPMFEDLRDYRPTFYGMVIAYKLLQEQKYLDAAIRGADWFIQNAVNTSSYLGVCGDGRFVSDFATIQSAQALLDLYELTGNEVYREAAVRVVRFYAASVYTHPIADRQRKRVGNTEREGWEIAQSGLCYEHGGILGSANNYGPILLASHAGLFVRMATLTGDSLLLNMARSAAVGRDAFVDDQSGVASYYWRSMNNGAGSYPHHAWWQLGWITDYLVSEASYRSHGQICFPAGFITPKVGPHRAYGFSSGKVYGHDAQLIMKSGLVAVDNPHVEALVAQGDHELYIILLNDLSTTQTAKVSVNPSCVFPAMKGQSYDIQLESYGLQVLTIQ